jgi:hypothetical protein
MQAPQPQPTPNFYFWCATLQINDTGEHAIFDIKLKKNMQEQTVHSTHICIRRSVWRCSLLWFYSKFSLVLFLVKYMGSIVKMFCPEGFGVVARIIAST